MTDSEMLEELKREVMALNAKNYCTEARYLND